MSNNQRELITQAVIESRILQLIYLAECDIECCKIIFNKKIKLATAIESYLTLIGNNHFFEAVNVISTILYPTREKKEISFSLWEIKSDQKIPVNIIGIKTDFKSQGFLEIRHNITAHTNAQVSGDPEIKTLLAVDDKFISNLSIIISMLQNECLKIFNTPDTNNYLLRGIKGGLEDILSSLQSIKKL